MGRRNPKPHAGFRLPADLITALDSAADALAGGSRTSLVQRWLTERAVAEGWMTPEQAKAALPKELT